MIVFLPSLVPSGPFKRARSHTSVFPMQGVETVSPTFPRMKSPGCRPGDPPRLLALCMRSVRRRSVEHERLHAGASNRRKNDDETDFKPRTAKTERKPIVGVVLHGIQGPCPHEARIARTKKRSRFPGKHQSRARAADADMRTVRAVSAPGPGRGREEASCAVPVLPFSSYPVPPYRGRLLRCAPAGRTAGGRFLPSRKHAAGHPS
jgi:hypothetical protein